MIRAFAAGAAAVDRPSQAAKTGSPSAEPVG
jgi:hypothetical protein